MFELAFMQRALVAGIIIGLVCGTLGFFIVLRRLAFIGVGISHSAIGGVAIGLLAGLNPIAVATVFAIAVAIGIAKISTDDRIGEDAVIGVFFSTSMALGVVLFSMAGGYQQDLFGYLFGNVLAISTGEVVMLAVASISTITILAFKLKEFLFIAFDEEIARAYGQPVDKLNTLLLVLIAVTVIIGVRLVGVLLIEALLVVPAATAALVASNFRGQLLLSALIGCLSAVGGLVTAYAFDLAAGGTIVLFAAALFFLTIAGQRLTRTN